MTFQRTPSGLVASFKFYDEPLIWVEGKDDIPFYSDMLQRYNVKLKYAGGKNECNKLIYALVKKNYPYIVITDGDYSILEKKRSVHRRVIILTRYSWENYLLNFSVIEEVVCKRLRECSVDCNTRDYIVRSFKKISDQILDYVVYDFAHQKNGTGKKCLPDKISPMLDNSCKQLKLSKKYLRKIEEDAKAILSRRQVNQAASIVNNFIKEQNRDVFHILKGHLLFSLICFVIRESIKYKKKGSVNLNDESISLLLISYLFKQKLASIPLDLMKVRKKIIRAINEII